MYVFPKETAMCLTKTMCFHWNIDNLTASGAVLHLKRKVSDNPLDACCPLQYVLIKQRAAFAFQL